MTMRLVNETEEINEIQTIDHFVNNWGEEFTIINQSYWYRTNGRSDEEIVKQHKNGE